MRPADGQSVRPADEAIREILRRRIDVEKRATGMAVGVLDGGQARIVTYGKQGVGKQPAVAANTLFEIGSLSKVFTALLLADMVHRKELQFEDRVDDHLPLTLRTPQHQGRAITLADLATHTSGLPLFPAANGDPFAVMARYTVSDLRMWLGSLKLASEPGAQWRYSNVGYCLLGLALANRARTTYEGLLQRRILRPLHLNDTTLRPNAKQALRLAIGYDARLMPVSPLDIGIFAPAGAIRSTIENLIRFAGALFPNSGSRLEKPAQLLLSIRRKAPSLGADQALGWEVRGGSHPFLAKDGVTAGQTASIVLDAPRRASVIVLSNGFPTNLKAPPDGGVGAADLARSLLRFAPPHD